MPQTCSAYAALRPPTPAPLPPPGSACQSRKPDTAQVRGGERIVHGRDGSIRDKYTIPPGNDPRPPRHRALSPVRAAMPTGPGAPARRAVLMPADLFCPCGSVAAIRVRPPSRKGPMTRCRVVNPRPTLALNPGDRSRSPLSHTGSRASSAARPSFCCCRQGPGPLPVRGTPSPFVSAWTSTAASSTIRRGSSRSSSESAAVAAGIVGALPAARRLLLRG